MALFIFMLFFLYCAQADPINRCEVRVRTSGGWVCGLTKLADGQVPFASFLGVPYAQQPVGDLRFKELQPVVPWNYHYDGTVEGPICPQHDVLYGPLMTNRNMSEACIYANVHVPLQSLPDYNTSSEKQYQSPFETGLTEEEDIGLPIIVFVHGGGFAFGSGGTDMHGPEYLIPKDFIVITFNYRLNVFGFLSLNSDSIPGNNGLRDMITLLNWVRENAKYFGGNPNDITLAGQSAGAASVHLLSLSTATEGLFQKAMLMSGTGIPSFYTTSPAYAAFISNLFITTLGLNETDPEVIHSHLVKMPLENIMEANKKVQDLIGLTAFLPVVETQHENVRIVLDEDPEILINKGRGKNIPLIIGFTSNECETFRRNFEAIDILRRIQTNPLLLLSPNVIYKSIPSTALDLAKKVHKKYFHGTPNMDNYIQSCSDTYYVYPAIKLAQIRGEIKGAPVFLYQYSYNPDYSVIKNVFELKFKGAGHIEDLTFIFKVNSFEQFTSLSARSEKDYGIIDLMTSIIKNFSCYSDSAFEDNQKSTWAVMHEKPVRYLDIAAPKFNRVAELTYTQRDMVKFFDSLQAPES